MEHIMALFGMVKGFSSKIQFAGKNGTVPPTDDSLVFSARVDEASQPLVSVKRHCK
jgi:hypothetical protein